MLPVQQHERKTRRREQKFSEVAEDNIEQPLDKQDQTEPVHVGGAKEGKGAM